jgi:hypothetical protein
MPASRIDACAGTSSDALWSDCEIGNAWTLMPQSSRNAVEDLIATFIVMDRVKDECETMLLLVCQDRGTDIYACKSKHLRAQRKPRARQSEEGVGASDDVRRGEVAAAITCRVPGGRRPRLGCRHLQNTRDTYAGNIFEAIEEGDTQAHTRTHKSHAHLTAAGAERESHAPFVFLSHQIRQVPRAKDDHPKHLPRIEREIVCVNNLVRKTTPQRGCERYSRSEQSLIGKHASGRAGEQYCELNASITDKQNRRLARQATLHTKTQQLCYKHKA